MADFSYAPNCFDSREVIERIEELESIEVIDRDEDEQDELDALRAFAVEADSIPDWEYGETFIRDDEFVNYTEGVCRDAGCIPDELPSWIKINWDDTADNLRADYTAFTFRGETYWARS